MFLKKAKIAGFGKILDKEFNFKPGLNVVFGPNESGKTTLAKFILYTLSTPSKDSLKYKPWNSDIFGGTLETSEGTMQFGTIDNKRYDKELLESVSFLMEDDDLETLRIDKDIIENSLKKKSERTETGRIIKNAIANLEKIDLSRCFTRLSTELDDVKKRLDSLKNNIKRKNSLYLYGKKLLGEINSSKNKLVSQLKELEEVRRKRTEDLKSEINRLKAKIQESKKNLNDVQWVEKIDQNIVFEISTLISKINNIRTEIDKLEKEEKALNQMLESKNSEIENRFKLLGVTSSQDLESVSLRLKHLNLLTKMYSDGIRETKEEDPLWHIFIEDPTLIDRAEDEEQRYIESKNFLEQQKVELQNKIEKTENNTKYSKDLSILFATAGIVLLVLGLLFNKLAFFMYIPSTILLGISVTLLMKWRKNIAAISVLQERLVEIATRQPEIPQTWKILSRYGIKNLKELRKKYAEFLEWKAANVENQRKLVELKEIEKEIIKELSRFNITAYSQMIISAVENLQRTFNEVQELIYEKESIERKIGQIKGEDLSLQKDLKNLHETLEEELKKYGVKRQDIENYRQYFEKYQEIKTAISEQSKLLEDLEKQLLNEDSDNTIRQLKTNITSLENNIKKHEEELEDILAKHREITVDYDEFNELIQKRDELEFKLKLISLLSSYIPGIFEYLKQNYANFVENYYKIFSEEFTKFFNHVSGQVKNFFVTPELTVKILVEGDLRDPADYLSGSTKDLIIFGIKNALYKAFYDGNLPLVIDNTLIRLDDNRLNKMCEFLREEANHRQIIILTSDKRVIENLHSEANILYLEG
ncbi:MAG: AAA family ATPase [Fervidobacterium sp.]|nr:AAA family ATPase [Fervidobacterium sp.]